MSQQAFGPALPVPEVQGPELPSTETACLKGHEGPVYAVRFNATGTYCLSCGKVGLCYEQMLRRAGSACAQSLPTCAVLQDRTLRLWNPHKGVPIKTYTGNIAFRRRHSWLLQSQATGKSCRVEVKVTGH